MPTQQEIDQFNKLFDEDVKNIDQASGGPYAEAIAQLLHLSGQISTEGTIAVTPTDTYAKLIALVQRASAMNLSQAALRDRITALGSTAVALAKKVEGLAGLFA